MNFKIEEFLCRHCGEGADIVKPELLTALQKLRDMYGKPMTVSNGFRCEKHNSEVGGAKHSSHLVGMAADISDPHGELKRFCSGLVLEACGLWMESPKDTGGLVGGWAHLQIRPVGSGRIFGK